MNKLYAFLALLTAFAGFSQGIQVNTSLTPDQLVNQVLINSPCVSGTSVVASTGANFGSTNGIGSFVNYNPNFPFASGIVLTTGDVTQAPSPNTSIQSNGSTAWPGDAELESVLLSQSGVTFSSINASYLQFNFTPTAPNFDFNFIFASEEYGASQCNFSDAFAFLLEDPMGNVTNLAVIAGTTPISVATIRDNQYNSGCPSVNPAFFGAYNGPGFGPAINFNGQTVSMTASATGLTVGATYRIKIVIADGRNSADDTQNVGYDSAIFIEGSSFNIGQNVLGPDLTAANGTALCPGTAYPTLQPVTPLHPATTYQWFQEGVAITGAMTAQLNLNSLATPLHPGINNFSLEYIQPGCTTVRDDIKVEVYPAINAIASIPDRYLCGAPYTFDLTETTNLIMTNNTSGTTTDDLPAGTLITYHNTTGDADSGTGDLPTNYTLTQALSPKTLYIRIENPTTGCYVTRTIVLHSVAPPAAIGPFTALTECARNATDTPPRANFDVSAIITQALAPQSPASDYVVTFHTTQANADNPNNNTSGVIGLTGTTILRPNSTVWVRVQAGNNPSCRAIASLQLIVTPLPQVDVLPDVVVCTSFTLPPLTYAGSQYRTADNGGGSVLNAGDPVTPTNVTTVYLWNPGSGTCPPGRDSFKVTKANLPAISPPATQAPICQTVGYTLPSLPYGGYFSGPNGVGSVTNTTITTPGTTNLYVHFENPAEPGCSQDFPFAVEIVPFTNVPDMPDAFACSSYTPPPAPAGMAYYNLPNGTGGLYSGAPFNTPGVYHLYLHKESGTAPTNCMDDEDITITIGPGNLPSFPNVSRCSSYTLPTLTVGEFRTAPNGGGTVFAPAAVINTSQTIYYYVPGEPCTNTISFNVTIQQTPLPAFPPVSACNVYNLPAVAHAGNYYTGPGGSGQLLPVGYPVISTQTIYFFDGDSTCNVEDSFLVTIDHEPLLDVIPQPAPICNGVYTIPTLVNGAVYANPGGPSPTNPPITGTISSTQLIWLYNASATGGCPPSEYSLNIEITNTTVTLPGGLNNGDTVEACDDTGYALPALTGPGAYYSAPVDPLNSSASTPLPMPYTVMSSMPIYVYAEDNNRIPCSDQKMFNVVIHPKPAVPAQTTVNACINYTLPAYTAPVTGYFEQPGGPNTAGNVEHFPGELLTSSILLYAYAASPSTNPALCPDEEPWQINITPLPTYTPVAEDTDGDFVIDYCDSYTLPAVTDFATTATGYVTANDGTDVPYGSATVTAPGATVYIRTQSTDAAACVDYKAFTINVYNSPVVAPIAGSPFDACSTPGFTLPALVPPATAYYTMSGGPNTPGNTLAPATVTTPGNYTFYAYAANGPASNPNLCWTEQFFTVTVSQSPVVQDYPDVYACDGWNTPTLTLQPNEVLYYDAAFTMPVPAGTNITTTTTLHVYEVSATNPNCNASDSFVVNITNTPVYTAADLATVDACGSYALPALTTPNAAYYDAVNGSVIATGTPYTTTTTVYVHAVNGTAPNTCPGTWEPKVINVYNVDEPVSIQECGSYELPALTAAGAAYYTGTNGTGTMYNPGDVLNTTTTLYVWGMNPAGTCSDESPAFTITINTQPVANPVTPLQTTVCDTDGDGDYDFDLDSLTATILGAQSPAQYAVTYYQTASEAVLGVNPITTDGGTNGDTAAVGFIENIFAVVTNIATPACKSAPMALSLTIVPKPDGDDLVIEDQICIDAETGTISPAYVVSGYSSLYYTFDWQDSTGATVSTQPNFTTTTPGDYTLYITSTINGLSGCSSDPIAVTIVQSGKPQSVDVEVTMGFFSDNQTIVVVATPIPGTVGTFLYSLDGSDPQPGTDASGTTFTGVTEGWHEVSVIDPNGCGSAAFPITVQTVYNPKYFTPNGDGVNDTYRIPALANQPGCVITIYDRYGKLLKSFTADSSGWDGTYNGTPLPADDYWLTVRYVENGVPKEYKSHFSLVR